MRSVDSNKAMQSAVNRRHLLMLLTLANSPLVAYSRSMERLAMSKIYRLLAGDGDPKYLGSQKLIKLVERDWFSGRLVRGNALLFQVVDGEFRGDYIALTARTQVNLREWLEKEGWASVVVQWINNPGPTFTENDEQAPPVGMTVVEDAKRSPITRGTRSVF